MRIKSVCAPFIICSCLFTITGRAQAVPDSVIGKIDSLFRGATKTTPGFAVGIIRNDTIIYGNGFGLANLEYAIPNTTETVYHMASISKQFTGYAILSLANAGKLKLDDDIRLYLKWFPDLKQKITIRHLLNHTSGIRDQWQLLAISGTRLDDVISQDHIVKILSKQRALNFKPGEQYSYSNSGFTMLAEIVHKVSGKTLREYTDSVIFKPLGMHNTHFHDDYTEIEKNRAYSYEQRDSTHFGNSILSYSNAGATSLFTTITDLSKWVMNFYTHKLNDEAIINELVVPGKLNDGTVLDYAQGIVVNKHKGWQQFSHGGADAGFRTYLTVFPELRLGFVVFSNLGNEDPGGKTYAIADYFIKEKDDIKKEVKPRDSTAAILSDPDRLKPFTGDYIAENGLDLKLILKNNQLHYQVDQRETNFLIPEANDTFSIPGAPHIKFLPYKNGKNTLMNIYLPGEVYHMTRYQKDTTASDATLRSYVGRYYCPELECYYGIELKDHSLVLTNAKYNDVKLTRLNKDHFTNDFWWMNHLQIRRNARNEVEGFDVNSGRIMHLRFDKVK